MNVVLQVMLNYYAVPCSDDNMQSNQKLKSTVTAKEH